MRGSQNTPPPRDITPGPVYHHIIEVDVLSARQMDSIDEEGLLTIAARVAAGIDQARINVRGGLITRASALHLMRLRGQDPAPVLGYYYEEEEKEGWT